MKAWFEECVNPNGSIICLYTRIELCDKTLEDLINELTVDSMLKRNQSLTIGYYMTTQIFIEILKGIN